MSPKVYVSYSPDTQSLAQQLTQELQQEGISSWASFKDIRLGQRLSEQLEEATAHADWFVILVRTGSTSSQWQETEWQRALICSWDDPQKRILPVVFGSGKVHPFWDWVPLQIADPDASPDWTKAVLQALRAPARKVSADRESAIESEKRFQDLERSIDQLWKVELQDRPVGKA